MPSIYRRICEEYRKTGVLPYNFMPEGIGATSVTAMRQNELPRSLREVCARKTWAAIFADGAWSVIEPVWFAGEFRQEALRRIDEGEISRAEAARRGLLLARDSDLTQAVEAGMILMGLVRDDLTEQVMERLALHSKFTQIAVAATQEWPDSNGRIFRWLQNTAGCGALVCAMSLKIETDEQRAWLLYQGMRPGMLQAEMAGIILARPSMEAWLRSLPEDAPAFHALCRLAAYAPKMSQAQADALALQLLRGLRYADGFIDLCAMHRLERVLLQGSPEMRALWRESVGSLRAQLRRRGVIEREMDNPKEEASLLALVLTGEDMTPPLERLTRVLASQELPEAMLRFLLLRHDEIYAAPLLECMLRVSPRVVFEDPPTVRDAREYPEGKYDLWLARALGAMCGDPALEESVILRCLEARLAAVRYQAVRCLQTMDAELSSEAEQALQRAIAQEPDMELRRAMQKLLNGMNPIACVRRRAILPRVDADALEACPLGQRLMYAEITSREKYLADGVCSLLEEGDRLLLTICPEDEGLLWAVTPGGLVIGEIELTAHAAAMRQWLEEGEILTAVLESGWHTQRLWADIRRPLQDVLLPLPQNVVRFPGK